MSVDVGNIIRVVATLNHPLIRVVQNVWHCKPSVVSDPSDTAWGIGINEWIDYVYQPIAQYYPSTTTFAEVEVFNMTKEKILYDGSWDSLTVGGTIDPVYTTQVSLVASALTQKKGVHGRKYFGPFTEVDIETGVFLAGIIADGLNTVSRAWLFSYAPSNGCGTLNGVIWSPTLMDDKSVRTIAVRDIPGVQRRRRIGQGL
jgi:hypothetical protein